MSNAERLTQIKLLLMGPTQMCRLSVHAGFSRYPGFPPQSKDKLTGLDGDSKLLLERVSEQSVCGCPVMGRGCVFMALAR